jgi:hypothetical protein
MLVGFALFERLTKDWECIEVFPQATVSALGAARVHKSAPGGWKLQLSALALYTGWPRAGDEDSFRNIAFGPPHDRLDAYLSAWVASLEVAERIAYGEPPDDVIWVPRIVASVR